MFGLALCSAIEPGLGIIASSLATLRPLVRTFSQTFSSWKSSRDSTRISENNQASTSQVMKQQKMKKLKMEKGFTSLGESTEMEVGKSEVMNDNTKQFESLSSFAGLQNENPVARKIRKVSWWRPATFPTGLMTEFRRAASDIQLESITPRSMASTGLDVETGSVPSNH